MKKKEKLTIVIYVIDHEVCSILLVMVVCY
jgi:hypothetical protein